MSEKVEVETMTKKTPPGKISKDKTLVVSKPTAKNRTSKSAKRITSMSQSLSLEQKLAQSEYQLAIINSVQDGLASNLDLQAIYDLIGDKIRDIFDAEVVMIGVYDHNTKLLQHPYVIERGVRFQMEPIPVFGFRKHVLETRQPLMMPRNTATRLPL